MGMFTLFGINFNNQPMKDSAQMKTMLPEIAVEIIKSENVVQGEPWGLHGVFSPFR